MKAEQTVFFPPFRLDKVNQQLWHGSHPIELRRKTFLVLQHLVEHPGQLATKEELLKAVWPGVYVSDTVLKVCIRELRRVLGERPAAPRFIETMHGRGYCFIGQKQGDRFQEFVEEKHGSKIENPSFDVRFQPIGSGQRTADLQIPSLQPQAPGSPIQRSRFNSQHSSSPVSPLVGRETELAQLYGWLEKAFNGERQFILISGEAGIGKTALVNTFLTQTAAEGSPWVARGQCIEHYGAEEPYFPVLDALSRLCREPGHEWLVTLLNQYAPLWLAQLPSLLSPADRKSLQRELAGASHERMLRELTEALEAVTKETPLIFILEDLLWSDSATLDFLSFFARRPGPARFFFIGTHRPLDRAVTGPALEAVRHELLMHHHCQELSLPLLTAEAIAQYLKTRFPDNTFPESFFGWIHQHTEGNPLFLVNVIEHLSARGIIIRQDNCWTLGTDIEAVFDEIPTDLQAVIEQQSDQISPRETQILQAASVAGMEFSAAAVAAALHTGVAEVEASCDKLAQRHLFLRSCGLSEWPDGTISGRYSFLHTLYRQAWYKRLTAAMCVQWHRAIGERLECAYGEQAYKVASELAIHFERGRDYRRAMWHRRQAADNAASRSTLPEASYHVSTGLELFKYLPTTSERSQLERVSYFLQGRLLI